MIYFLYVKYIQHEFSILNTGAKYIKKIMNKIHYFFQKEKKKKIFVQLNIIVILLFILLSRFYTDNYL